MKPISATHKTAITEPDDCGRIADGRIFLRSFDCCTNYINNGPGYHTLRLKVSNNHAKYPAILLVFTVSLLLCTIDKSQRSYHMASV